MRVHLREQGGVVGGTPPKSAAGRPRSPGMGEATAGGGFWGSCCCISRHQHANGKHTFYSALGGGPALFLQWELLAAICGNKANVAHGTRAPWLGFFFWLPLHICQPGRSISPCSTKTGLP